MKRNSRSKTGCQTCRAKKVKCDEQRPECARCKRLQLTCNWAQELARNKRRGRDRAPTCRDLQPRPTSPIPDLAQTPVSASVAIIEKEDPGSFIVETSRLFDDVALPLDASILATPNSLVPSWDAFCAPAPWCSAADIGYVFNGNGAIEPLAGSLISSDYDDQASLCCIPLSPLDNIALDHYSNAVTRSFTPKSPKWSTLTMLRSISISEPMLMHLLLAVALNDMWCRGKQSDPELQEAARQHYTAGEGLVADMRNTVFKSKTDPGAVATNHLQICTAFWFMYMYQTRMPDIDSEYLGRLSLAVAAHVRAYGLDELCTNGSVAATSGDAEPTPFSAADGALIASVMIGLYFEDVKYGFYRCGGWLAKHLNCNKTQLGRVYDLGRNALALYWGAQYPLGEFMIDLNNYTNLKFNSELHIILQDINSTFSCTKYDAEAEKLFTSQLDELGARYAVAESITEGNQNKGAASSPSDKVPSGQSRPASVEVVCTGVGAAYFHAIRIYIFRCAVEPQGGETPPQILRSLKAVLQIARSVLKSECRDLEAAGGTRENEEIFHRLEWPLFIAGVETQDVFYQDWIVRRMYKTRIKKALESVLEEQARAGKRVGVEFMRQALL
ncbi:unnamed protein product [Fusarium graminearum]|uniref:Zn(2)-C6 fungal-type domain-containing protein n=1 Tax=Gibberella zeae TaxID=5518 RepID=A0A9N8NN82_GIBZA|nr:unnamed protein product [Fusarium graminearum]CAG1980989.1 unnamed protein product [Fusarium graminearum]